MNFSNCSWTFALILSGTLFFLFADNAAAFSSKDGVVDEVDISGTRYYGRVLAADDFNNDGTVEFIYIEPSPRYMEYVWSSEGQSKKYDKNYNKQGIRLSKSSEWFASFLPSTIENGRPVEGKWQAKFNGNLGCVHPSQIIPAALNEDAFLDFIVPCHGYDSPPFPGEDSLVLLSDGPNNYNITKLTKNAGFYHDGAVADFNSDSKMDILLVDAKAKKLRVFLNQGGGQFKLSENYLPNFSSWKGAYTTEILDVDDDGFFDIFVAGHEDDKYGRQPTLFLLGNKNNKFSTSNKLVIPPVKGYGIVLDVIKEGDNLFVLRRGSGERAYKGAAIQNVNINSLETINVLKRENMKGIGRIFRKKDAKGRLKFGSLTNKYNDIDFVFSGKEIQLIN